MMRSSGLLKVIRDAADAFGTAQLGILLQSAGLKRPGLVRALADLARRGLVEIDRDSGAVSLTVSGRAELFAHAPTLGPNIGRPYQPAGYALTPAAAAAPLQPPASLTGKAAAAAVKQARDTAAAVVRRQAARKAASAAKKSAKPKAAAPAQRTGPRARKRP